MTDPGLDEREGPDADLEPSLGGGDGRDLEEDRAGEEPMLGWPEQFGQGGGGLWDGQDDREECVPVGTSVQVERDYGYGPRRLRNVSDRQREALSPQGRSAQGDRLTDVGTFDLSAD
jgi:hypothetical protein